MSYRYAFIFVGIYFAIMISKWRVRLFVGKVHDVVE